LENDLDGIQIELSRHVEDGIIFIIKTLVCLGVVVLAFDQMLVEGIMREHVSIGDHGDEAGMLQKTRINATPCTGVTGWNAVNEVVLKPLIGLGGGQAIDLGG